MVRVEYAPEARETLLSESLRAGPLETGGVLVGKRAAGGILCVRASGPGPNARASSGHYVVDKAFDDSFIAQAESEGLAYLGPWHKHPSSYREPSSGDWSSIEKTFASCPQLKEMVVTITTLEDGTVWLLTFYKKKLEPWVKVSEEALQAGGKGSDRLDPSEDSRPRHVRSPSGGRAALALGRFPELKAFPRDEAGLEVRGVLQETPVRLLSSEQETVVLEPLLRSLVGRYDDLYSALVALECALWALRGSVPSLPAMKNLPQESPGHRSAPITPFEEPPTRREPRAAGPRPWFLRPESQRKVLEIRQETEEFLRGKPSLDASYLLSDKEFLIKLTTEGNTTVAVVSIPEEYPKSPPRLIIPEADEGLDKRRNKTIDACLQYACDRAGVPRHRRGFFS